MQKTFIVSKEFILSAHKAACSEWKIKFEKEFPGAFIKKKVTITENSYDKHGVVRQVKEFSLVVGDKVRVTDGSYNSDVKTGKERWGIDNLFKNYTAKIVSISEKRKSKFNRTIGNHDMSLMLVFNDKDNTLIYCSACCVETI